MSEITKDRILETLQDGKWWAIKEIAEKLGCCYKYTAMLCAELWWENKIERAGRSNGLRVYAIATKKRQWGDGINKG